MESYVEIVFIHNLLIHAVSLTLSNIFSRKTMSKNHFLYILLLSTFLPSFLFLENDSWIWILEIFIFIFCFYNRTHSYLIFVGNRLLFLLIYYFFFEGTIKHHLFFPFSYSALFVFDFIVFFLYISLLMKGKFYLSENDFTCIFYLNNKKYKGFIDSGNFATYQSLPIIFIQDNIFNEIQSKCISVEIETMNHDSEIQAKETMITINKKIIRVLCTPLMRKCNYDAILNMKGIL